LAENVFDNIKKIATTTTERLSQVEGFSINRVSPVIEEARSIMAKGIMNTTDNADNTSTEKKSKKDRKKDKKEKIINVN